MMFIVRSAGAKPDAVDIRIKAVRDTPDLVSGGRGKTDYFCVGEPDAIAALRGAGWEIVELRDGWYENDTGGGIAISGHGRYWEVRDTHFTVRRARRRSGRHSRRDLRRIAAITPLTPTRTRTDYCGAGHPPIEPRLTAGHRCRS
jgi:hypothetical protein